MGDPATDLEECWADILPPPRPRPAPTAGVRDHVWMGLLNGDHEINVGGYHRQRVWVQNDVPLDLRGSFYPFDAAVTITGMALYSHDRGDPEDRLLCRSDFNTGERHLLPGDMMQAFFTISDPMLNGPGNPRRMLERAGIL